MERTETQRRILEVGKKEFLEKGFKDASLNQIVAEAGFTKGAFYGYYPDKTALFEDLVGETASELLTRFKAAQDDYFDLVPEGRAKDSLELSTQHLHELVAFMYDHSDEFKLILCRAEGTGYADFIEVLVDLEVDRSEEYYALLRNNGMLSGSMTRQLHHMITRAYFTAVCETIVHDMPREEAMKYVDELAVFFHSGWYALAAALLSAVIYFAGLMCTHLAAFRVATNMRDGRIAAEYTPEDLLLLPEKDILHMGLRSPHEGKCLPAPSVLDESPAVLKTAGLSKRISKEVIFEDISLCVPKGKVSAITGQNGAGKTTLAQILCGLARQTRGHILIDGKKARAAVRRREIYYCGNDTSTQFFTASVAEELLLNARLTEENKSHARILLNEFGLYEYRDAHPSTLSGGQKQRLAIACAVFSGRGILILDEPTSGLDGQNMRLIAERLKSEARNGRTILVITHDRELIESCCDNVVEVEKRSL